MVRKWQGSGSRIRQACGTDEPVAHLTDLSFGYFIDHSLLFQGKPNSSGKITVWA